ncbi:unnamed protein product (plasmid) [Mycetohabitans rhizoxinica HKI 454]|uniref:Uncharacterized protein n=1 Tax=Mycetohabitans rhizoxinica (strain DSM 19002 / CIP 109453 / HKI 454) TaxID=882378 RepID=E5AUX7_MYCRK|nr:unnamed protein product [Mycetohabitans rhizoxinica HKI 454]
MIMAEIRFARLVSLDLKVETSASAEATLNMLACVE